MAATFGVLIVTSPDGEAYNRVYAEPVNRVKPMAPAPEPDIPTERRPAGASRRQSETPAVPRVSWKATAPLFSCAGV